MRSINFLKCYKNMYDDICEQCCHYLYIKIRFLFIPRDSRYNHTYRKFYKSVRV